MRTILLPGFLNAVVFGVRFGLAAFAGTGIQQRTGINGWDLPMFATGVLIAAWAPFIGLMYSLKQVGNRLASLESGRPPKEAQP